MKYQRILFAGVSVLLLGFLILIFTSPRETRLTAETTTEIPQPVVFKQLAIWLAHDSYLIELPDSVRMSCVLFDTMQVNYRLNFDKRRFTIDFVPLQKNDPLQPFKGVRQKIGITRLADGTTGIHWELWYDVPGFTPRLLNRLFWKKRLKEYLQKQMQQVRKYLES